MVLEENEDDKMARKVTNKEVIERKGEKRTLLNDALNRNCLLRGSLKDSRNNERNRKQPNIIP